jgi:hypothetical protein
MAIVELKTVVNMNSLAMLVMATVSLLACSSVATKDRATASVDVQSAASTQAAQAERGQSGRSTDPAGPPKLDPSKPVPAKSEVLQAWRKRQDSIKSFRFVWTEQQSHPQGWIPNPRYPEREWLSIPGLTGDRSYSVSKSLFVDGIKMRYAFEIDRKEEPDGVRVISPTGEIQGFGVRRHYSYVSLFDGQKDEIRLSSLMESPPPTTQHSASNVDAQNLDTRAIMLAFRPLDPVMGHLLIERAVTNGMRTFYREKSTFMLEERHDPSGWKTMLWIEPERDFLVSRYVVTFEQKFNIDMEIDYALDARWGWIPSGWRVTERLADGSRRLVVEAKVTSYSINQAIGGEEFR